LGLLSLLLRWCLPAQCCRRCCVQLGVLLAELLLGMRTHPLLGGPVC